MPNCLNCNDPWVQGEIYCSSCGQKTKIPNLNLWSLIKDFFQNLFNLDAKIWMTLKDIWVPAKITSAYLHGQRIKYYNPIRIFLISMFALIALILYITGSQIDKTNAFSDEQKKLAWEDDAASKLDTIYEVYGIDTTLSKKFKSSFLSENPITKLTEKDTIISAADGKIMFSGFTASEGLSAIDIYQLSDEEFKEKHKDKGRFEFIWISQIRKIFQEPSNGIKFAIGNGVWATILLIIFFAVFYKLMYIRRDYLFVEHFLFHLNGHTRLVLIAILFGFMTLAIGFKEWYDSAFLLIGAIYLFIDTKRFYKQSYIKTFFKMLIGCLAYFFFATICMTGIIAMSLFFF